MKIKNILVSIALSLALVGIGGVKGEAGTISVPNTFSAGTVAVAAEVNSNFTTVYNEFNGSIDNANIGSSAAIAYSKLNLTTSVVHGDLATGFQWVTDLVFEGATADGFETILRITDPTVDRVFTFPDVASDTVVFLTATQTLSGKTLTTPTIGATGWTNATHAHAAANSGSQLPFTSLTGSVTDAQVPNTITLDSLTQVTTRSHDALTSGVSADDHHAQNHTGSSTTHTGTPGGELGNTWTSPTIDSTHSGTAHHLASAAGPPNGTASGELGGSYPSPTVDSTHSGSAHHTRSHNISGASDHAGFEFIRKTADESVTSSTTMQDDNHFSFAIGSTETWWFRVVMKNIEAGAGDPDLDVTLTGPTGIVGHFGNGVGGSAADFGTEVKLNSATVSSISTVVGFARTTGTSGTIQFRWAQNASSSDAITINADSYLIAWRL